MGALNFDPFATLREIEKAEGTPAKVANPANQGAEFSNLSNISRRPPQDPEQGAASYRGSSPATAAERSAKATPADDITAAWRDGVSRLRRDCPAPGFTLARWQQLVDNAHRFRETWAGQALRLGWAIEDVFGVHPTVPAARYDHAGLILFINDGEVVAMTEMSATIRRTSTNELTFRRQTRAGSVPIWTLMPVT